MPTAGLFIDSEGQGVLVPVGISYILDDEFTTARSAGSVNGTAAEPGPGTRTIVGDASNFISLVGGLVAWSGGYADSTKGIIHLDGKTRVPGLMCLASAIAQTAISFRVGFGTNAGDSRYGTFDLNSAGLNIYPGESTVALTIGTVVGGTVYKVVRVVNTVGSSYYIKGGVFTNWTLLFRDITGNAATLYPIAGLYTNSNIGGALDYLRVPTYYWEGSPILYDAFTGTWPTTDGYAGDSGYGAGGGGLTWLDGGTWSISGGYGINTPSTGTELLLNPNFDTDLSNWTLTTAGGTIVWGAGGVIIFTEPGTSQSMYASQGVTTVAGLWYKAQDVSVAVTQHRGWLNIGTILNGQQILNLYTGVASPGTLYGTFRAVGTTTYLSLEDVGSATNVVTYTSASLKPIPNSSLFTNMQLGTTDVYAEQVIHAFTADGAAIVNQVGMIINADRSFAAKCNGSKSAGTAVIALKQVTGVGGVGLSTSDTVTIAGTTYTIVSITGGSNVAYNDTTKTQTVTLSSDPGALSDGAAVGLNWASWNGVVGPYFDGSGNIKLDEVVAGVYTNRLSVATSFVADKRLIVRKVGTEYRVFYNEALVGTTTAVATGATTGLYHGMFSTDSTNTVKSIVIYDTGNVTNEYTVLDGF